MGDEMVAGQIITAPSEQWIDNRIADNGLVERIADEPAIETATAPAAAETADMPRPRGRKEK
jgi:hypothetical protein